MNRYAPIGDFSRAFAQEYKAFMVANDVRGFQIATKLDRAIGYVSERINGKRPLDTEDVDALAMLVPGWSGKTLLIELARRAKETMTASTANVVRLDDHRVGEVDDELAAAHEQSSDRGEDDGYDS